MKKLTFILDWDGTIFVGLTPIKNTIEAFKLLTEIDANIIYLTNNSSKSSSDYYSILKRNRLWNKNCNIITSGLVAAWFIKDVLKKNNVFIIGTPSLVSEFKQYGLITTDKNPSIVLLGFDKTMNYRKIQKAHEFICKGIPFFATHDDKVCPGKNHTYVDCGSIIEMLKSSTQKSPIIIGKPHDIIQSYLKVKYNLESEHTYFIGDRLETDGLIAKKLNVNFYKVNQNSQDKTLTKIITLILKNNQL